MSLTGQRQPAVFPPSPPPLVGAPARRQPRLSQGKHPALLGKVIEAAAPPGLTSAAQARHSPSRPRETAAENNISILSTNARMT